MPNENPEGTISEDQAVELLLKPNDEAAEPETADEGTGDGTPEEAPAEAVAGEDEPTFEFDLPDGKRKLSKAEIEAELKDGGLRLADYTRKTMDVANQRKQIEALQAEVTRKQEQLDQSLQYWAVPADEEPDWGALMRSRKPEEVFAAKAEWDKRQKRAEKARKEYQALREAEIAETKAREWGKLVEAVPEWADQSRFETDYQKMLKGAAHYDLSADEVGAVLDHRLYRVLRDATAYRELLQKAKAAEKKVAAAPKALTPGAKPDTREDEKAARQKLRAQLRQTGSDEDAIALLMTR